MKAPLNLEYIGAANADLMRGMSHMLNTAANGLGRKVIGDGFGSARPWVAEIIGSQEGGTLIRNFLKSNRDYSKANSKGTRGVRLLFILESGKLYEVHERTSWRSSRRYFCAVTESGSLYELSEQEAKEWQSAL